ncbi:related to kinesin [Lecanosticta acicola]|uniref:Related to kinesin n=1 Tax=Lecanosticta acicola TaxID=111012 RepID=A0AAI8YU16_9PEZI|nr:related to kinesin [Lecanosticta acicola]
MRHNHTRTSSRLADVASRASDEEGARTAVKVAVRVRPPLKPTDPGFDLIPQRFRESTCEVTPPTNLCVQSPQGRKLFVFDRVFDEDTTQEGVWEYVSDGVSSFVKGYNVSILAYGQSGAGKSYTMGTSGPEDQNDQDVRGIVPRAAHALFEKLNGTTSKPSGLQTPKRYSTQALPTLAAMKQVADAGAKNWELRATYVEIYNEQLRDLLVPENTPLQDRAQVAIREDTRGRIMLTGLTQVPINSPEDLLNALNFGSAIRQTDATAINARSSRSHAVFSLNLVQKKSDQASAPIPQLEKRRSTPVEHMVGAEGVVTIDSKLHFVDLAGSERLKNTGATGDRAKEGISINAGLASLGKVISQLSSKHSGAHISYRDSRLTRLLQDSLGGSAITYMVACVTPAVFHLSETLNTVHYAQRARAIQSKPEIQQSHEEGDKQAAIDRLRAEVSFLRSQIRHSEQTGDRNTDSGDRSDRLRGKERELQSQLMDMQENYNALSQRHAKLISEISRSRDNEDAETPLLNEAIGDNASERIKRSNSFAEAVEQVVLEYEKTIQSLEGSLSKTRANLANTESTLMEKETRIAYMDTIQQQLQARISKYLEREANNDSYTRDLESKMEGATSEEEKKETLITELRKELARVRESEAGAEDYISTLEERLAEAEQDSEIMQREIDRLEHVVERQRSIGRLDNLLGELDVARGIDSQTNGRHSSDMASRMNGHVEDDDDYDPFRASSRPTSVPEVNFSQPERFPPGPAEDRTLPDGDAGRSPAQNDFVAEKLESLTQEFFDLRSEHETVVTNYENLEQKYRTALETLARLEYGKSKPPGTPEESTRGSFLAEAGMKDEEQATGGQPSSSRLLSEEQSSREPQNTGEGPEKEPSSTDIERPAVLDHLAVQNVAVQNENSRSVVSSPVEHEEMVQEMETLRKLHAEKEVSVTELTKNYMSLAQRHEATLTQVEELKQEVQKSQRAQSPTFQSSPGFSKSSWRRRSDDLLGGSSDRASRSFVSMKTMVLSNFGDQADVRQNFEQHLTTVMAELHNRSERMTALESELTTIKKEMENKQQIITGLTRERTSLAAAQASGADFSVVGQMRDQLMESENQIRILHEQNIAREKELQSEVDSLKASLAEHQKNLSHENNRLPTPAEDLLAEPQADAGAARASRMVQMGEINRLQSEVTAWENKHRDAMDSMTATQAELMNTITDLQQELHKAEKGGLSSRAVPEAADSQQLVEHEIVELERQKHRDIVMSLEGQINEHKKIADERVSRLEQLQQAYANMLQQVDDDSESRQLAEKELATHKDLVSNLENQLQVHKSAITIHQESLESLQSSHTKEIEDLTDSMNRLEKELNNRYAAVQEQHEKDIADLSEELNLARNEMSNLLRNAAAALGYETDSRNLQSQIQGLVEEGKELHARHLKTTNELKAVQEELQSAINRSVEMDSQITELNAIDEEKSTALAKMTEKYNKSAALVDQLEEQLNNNFDSYHATNKRMSSMQSEQVQARIELEQELEEQRQQLDQYKHMSVTSNGSSHFNRDSLSPDTAAQQLVRSGSGSGQASQRKSGPTALPTPPPSIPLPPLPASPIFGGFSGNSLDRNASPDPRGTSPVPGGSPPQSRHASHEVSPNPAAVQLIEEQEARIRTIEKHLFAEKQLTATLEEALVDLETSANRTKSEMENWRKKCQGLEDELVSLRKERSSSRASLQAVEEEREMRVRAERARQALEQRMAELNANKKKKKGGLNCF